MQGRRLLKQVLAEVVIEGVQVRWCWRTGMNQGQHLLVPRVAPLVLPGEPRKKSGPQPGQPSTGGRRAYLEHRKADHDIARLAQAQYEELVQLRENPA